MKRKKGSKERRERKGRGEEGSRGWREGRKEENKGRREREELPKRVQNCGKSRFYLETAALYIISVGFPCKP